MYAATTLPPSATKSRSFIAVLLTLMVIEAAGIFEQTMVAGAIPFFANLFETDLLAVSWLITVFILVGAVSAVVAGRLGDIFGRKKVLAVLLVISLIGSIVSLAFGTLPALIIGRALQGTSAGIIPLLIGVARETMAPKRVPVAISIITSTAILAGGLGVFVAGILIEAGVWQSIFIASGALAALALILGMAVLPRSLASVATDRKVDWIGAILLAPAIMAVLFGLSTARSAGFTSPIVLTCVIGGAIILAFWVWWELRVKSPIVNLRYLVDPKVAKTIFAVILLGLGAFSVMGIALPVIALTPAELPIGVGLTISAFGLISLIGATIGFGLSPLSGRLVAKYGGGPVLSLGGILAMISYVPLLIEPLNKQQGVVIAVMLIGGVATTFLVGAVYNLMVEAVPAGNTSEFIGVLQVIRNIAIAIGTVIASTIISSSSVPETSAPTTTAWMWTIVYLLVAVAALTTLALTIGRRVVSIDAVAPVGEAAAAPAKG